MINYAYLKGIIFTNFTAIKTLDVVICPEDFLATLCPPVPTQSSNFEQEALNTLPMKYLSGPSQFFFFFGTALSRFLYHFILCWTAGLLYPSYSHNRLVNTNFLKEKASSLLIKCLDYTVGTGLTILEIRVLSKVPCPSTFVQCQ